MRSLIVIEMGILLCYSLHKALLEYGALHQQSLSLTGLFARHVSGRRRMRRLVLDCQEKDELTFYLCCLFIISLNFLR